MLSVKQPVQTVPTLTGGQACAMCWIPLEMIERDITAASDNISLSEEPRNKLNAGNAAMTL